MKVEKWCSDKEAEGMKMSVGGLGGWFGNGHRWEDFIDIWHDEVKPYLEAIRTSVLENSYKFSGNYHQNGPNGVPVFEDGTMGSFSFRAWGDLMAAIWSTEENKDYHYMDFYM